VSRKMTTRMFIFGLVTLIFLGQVFIFTDQLNAASSTITQTLRQGSKGAQVKILQEKLNSLGFNAGKVDGSFGPKTKAAVLAFQKAHGLARDGVVGPATRAKLNSITPAKSKPQDPKPESQDSDSSRANNIPPVTQTLRRGSKGTQVKYLQQKLNALGFNVGGVDGSFGPKTLAGVRAFQKANGLAVDGVVGPATRAKLNSATPSQSKPSDPKPENPKPEDPKPKNPPTKEIPPVTQTLRRGSKGTQVKYLQQKLNALGFNVGEVDGSFGPKTLAGVRAFQKANGLAVDGVVGPATRAKLNSISPTKPKPEDPKPENPKPEDPKPENPKPETPPTKEIPPVTQTLRRGDKGTQVRYLQEKLNYLGFDVGEVDGSFGPKTLAGVLAFQGAYGLARDGVVGPATRAKLNSATPGTVPKEPEYKEFVPEKGQLSGKTIILDPGHGGMDSGAAWNGNLEKTFNLDMALRLKRMLEQAGAKVLMTRTKDEYSYLYYRTAFVNKYIVDLEIKDQEAQKKALMDEKNAKTAESLTKGEELDAKKNEYIAVQTAIIQLQPKIQAKEDDLSGAVANLEQLNSKLNALILQMNNMGYESLQDLKNTIAGIEVLLNTINELKGEISGLKAQIESCEEGSEEYYILKESLAEKEKDLKDAEGELFELANGSSSIDEVIALLGDLKKLSDDIEKQDETVTEAEKDVSKKQSELDVLNKDLNNLKSSEKAIEDEISRLEDEIPKLAKDIANLELEISGIEIQITDLKDKARLLQNNLNNPTLKSRTGIYVPSSTSGGKNIINKKLKEIFDLTRAKYDNDMIFIAIHCNAMGGGGTTTASGVQVYYRDSSSDNGYATNQNYYTNYNDNKRLKLAKAMLKNTRDNTDFKGRWTTPFKKDFHVLREQNLPSVLMEIGFVNNPDDVRLLNQERTRENAAKGMYLGIVEYFTK
jgi:peptidoglycan hydrolase-like protein with peptidoglycan-binding domain